MHEMPPKIAKLNSEQLMALSGEERFIIGCQMFVAWRAKIIASLPPDLPSLEFKRQLFQRIYGYPLPF